MIGPNRVDVLRETGDNATGRVETDNGIVGVTVQDRKERVVSQSVARDNVVGEVDKRDQFGGDAGIGYANNIGWVMGVNTETRGGALELTLDARKDFGHGRGGSESHGMILGDIVVEGRWGAGWG
jgi:hypothetical protein